jgi:hypothetical protein
MYAAWLYIEQLFKHLLRDTNTNFTYILLGEKMTFAPTQTISPANRVFGSPPSTMHPTLLQAAILREQPALDAWQKWRQSVDIETLDSESHHLLSTLYPNLVRHGVEDPHISRLKGVYRRTWYVNQLLAQSFAQV